MMLAAFVNHFDESSVGMRDLAQFFGCGQVKILTYWDAIEELVHRKYLRKNQDREGTLNYTIPSEVMAAIREDRIFTPRVYKNLTAEQWFDRLSELLDKKDHDRISYSDLLDELRSLIADNQHLIIARELATIPDEENRVLFLGIMDLLIQNNDNHIIATDVEDLLENRWMMRRHTRQLERGIHPLQQMGLVEYSNSEGQVEKDAWMLTEAAKKRFLPEMDLLTTPTLSRELRPAEKIVSKRLYFSASVSRQVQQLESLLQPERFRRVQERLEQHGMRRGFACIFYGSPGTGKTETVLQLARETGRAILQVDVPNLRSKWVGDTEKNIKAVFDRYRRYCNQQEVAPILLFNEADAVLCRRSEGATNGVDKMENAMQNIILQEMETLDGIMIATTNLTGNLDAAFERRFLYKIEFPKPTPAESRHIWQSMLPELTEQNALDLAREYSFSGGQIENIARKHVVDAILSGEDTLQMTTIREACQQELFHHKISSQIGFC